jgi:biopolymer transport protein ExbD
MQVRHPCRRAVRLGRREPNGGLAVCPYMIVLCSKRTKRRRRVPVATSLQLTPLIDIFMVMVLFLLATFHPGADMCMCRQRLSVPTAERLEGLERAPVVTMTASHEGDGVVTLDGREVGTVRELLDDDSPDWKLARLTEQLEVMKHNWKLTNPDKVFPGELIIEADRETDFKAIKKVVYSSGLAGYLHYQLVAELPAGKR